MFRHCSKYSVGTYWQYFFPHLSLDVYLHVSQERICWENCGHFGPQKEVVSVRWPICIRNLTYISQVSLLLVKFLFSWFHSCSCLLYRDTNEIKWLALHIFKWFTKLCLSCTSDFERMKIFFCVCLWKFT